MELNILWMTLLFSCVLLIIGFGKKFQGDLTFQFFGGLGLILTGINIFQVTYVGWIMMNVDTYTIKADMVNGLGNAVIGFAFAALGFLVMLKASVSSWQARGQNKDKYASRERYTT
jgi:hypothetical protein